MDYTALESLYNALMNGEQYGTLDYWNYYENKPLQYAGFYTVLYKDPAKNIFHWANYGSSANKATLKDLQWILETIFHTNAHEFTQKFMTMTEYNRLKETINNMIERGEKLY